MEGRKKEIKTRMYVIYDPIEDTIEQRYDGFHYCFNDMNIAQQIAGCGKQIKEVTLIGHIDL